MHTHIIGSGGQGKSSMLVYHMIHDIEAGNGFCFLDPSWQGNTMKKVLAYCEEIGFNKVIVIDPHDHYLYHRIVPLNPFTKYKEEAVAKTMAIIQALFGMKDMADYLRIERYYASLVAVLHNAGMTMDEAFYFTSYEESLRPARDVLLNLSRLKAHQDQEDHDLDGTTIRGAFKSLTVYNQIFGSTINRLTPFFHKTLRLMFGTRDRLNWPELIDKGWIVLVNLHTGGSIRQLHARLLGTAVLGEILDAFNRLGRHDWKGRFYVYVDECGQFINEQVIDFLYHKRQAGLSMILAHQVKAQFPTPDAKSAVDGQTYIKIAFHQPDTKDREETAKAMYYGRLDQEAKDALVHLKKQQAAIKIGKDDPQFIWIPDLPKFPDKPSKEFMTELYSIPVYQDDSEIIHDQKNRIYENSVYYPTQQTNGIPRENNLPPKKTSKTNRRANNQARVRQPQNTHEGWTREAQQFGGGQQTPGTDGEQEG
jgi:hypothetical protein